MTKRHPETRARAKELRRNMTLPEARLWSALRAGQIGVKFQRQVELDPYIADFAARSARLVVELDGDSHAEAQAYDAARTRSLEARGYRVIRFTNAEVMGNLDGILRTILIILGRDPESPHPVELRSPLAQGERVAREAKPGVG
jgi:very-short-patch-repair endonuclease